MLLHVVQVVGSPCVPAAVMHCCVYHPTLSGVVHEVNGWILVSSVVRILSAPFCGNCSNAKENDSCHSVLIGPYISLRVVETAA
jgi:hypothetical protein